MRLDTHIHNGHASQTCTHTCPRQLTIKIKERQKRRNVEKCVPDKGIYVFNHGTVNMVWPLLYSQHYLLMATTSPVVK